MKYDGLTVKAWAGTSAWRAWRADLGKYRMYGYSGWGSEGFWMLTLYRLQRTLLQARPRWLWLLPRMVVAVIRKFATMVTHISLPPGASIGPGLLIPHVGPIQLNAGTVIGVDCTLMHVVTIGAGARPGSPMLGDHVFVGCHSCILGGVTVGDFANVGAGAVVIRDVPPNHSAMGVPARSIPKARPDDPAEMAREINS
ncbi:MAG: serine acetyltransferase [Phycisphaerae bacterium]